MAKLQKPKKPIETVLTGSVDKVYDLSKNSDLWGLIKNTESEDEIKRQISVYLNKLVEESGLGDYKIVFLYDDYFSITSYHSNKIYEAISDCNKSKNILMILLSDGGRIEPAYLISKTCKRLAKDKFVISVPRKAKSAATLICLGADEVHMGLLSELGPIDPQINGFPALGLANAVEKIASLTSKFPDSAEMFAKYITTKLDIKDLGYYERINESAIQYAQRLLDGKVFTDRHTAQSLADHFTNHYKDHAFVIDVDEASKLLTPNMIKESTKEYSLGNEIHTFLNLVDILFRVFKKKSIRYVGSIETGMDTTELKAD